jgi:hypothetical protein
MQEVFSVVEFGPVFGDRNEMPENKVKTDDIKLFTMYIM